MIHRLDVRGMLCPIPVIRTQNAVRELANGDILEVIATDPGAANDIPAWCRVHGHEVITLTEQDHELMVTLRVIKPTHQNNP